MSPDRSLLCLGFGYTARHLAQGLPASGWRIIGSSRTEQGADAIRRQGFEAVVFDRDHPQAAAQALETASCVLISIAPDETGDPVLDGLGEALAAADHLTWIGYLSTTGVYGDTGGAWVDELTPPAPGQARSQRRLAAENGWLGLAREQGRPVEVFRLAGIYGPGRSALDSLRAGRAHRVVKPGHVVCRIHVDDIAGTLRAAMAAPHPGAVYNLADDEPAPPQDVVAEASALLGLEPPPEVALDQADLSPMARSFYAETRRVWNGRIKTRLGVTLAHPTYREGLRAILAAERAGSP